MLNTMHIDIVGFEQLKNAYPDYLNFIETYSRLSNNQAD